MNSTVTQPKYPLAAKVRHFFLLYLSLLRVETQHLPPQPHPLTRTPTKTSTLETQREIEERREEKTHSLIFFCLKENGSKNPTKVAAQENGGASSKPHSS